MGYRKFRKNTLLELVTVLDDGSYLVQNEGDSSDRWVIPKATFESTYDEVYDGQGYARLFGSDGVKNE